MTIIHFTQQARQHHYHGGCALGRIAKKTSELHITNMRLVDIALTRVELLDAGRSNAMVADGPHLHFHVTDANSSLGAEGLPCVFSRFDVGGRYESMAAAESNAPIASSTRNPRTTPREELPAANSIVEF